MFEGCVSLEGIALGQGYAIPSFPTSPVEGGRWWSVTDKSWYGSDAILADRIGVADTYAISEHTPIALCVISLSDRGYTCDGAQKTPVVTVTCAGKTLASGVDYDLTVTPGSCIDAGTYRCAIVGKGNYYGSRSTTFVIEKAQSRIVIAEQSKPYTGESATYSGVVTRSGSSGEVTYKYYSDPTCVVELDALSVKSVGAYYVQAVLAGDANRYAAVSVPVRFTITSPIISGASTMLSGTDWSAVYDPAY